MTEEEQKKLLEQARSGEISWDEYSRKMDEDLMHGPGAGRPLGIFRDPVQDAAISNICDELEASGEQGKKAMQQLGATLLRRIGESGEAIPIEPITFELSYPPSSLEQFKDLYLGQKFRIEMPDILGGSMRTLRLQLECFELELVQDEPEDGN